jgi:lipopolysaccharide export system protein LptC
MNIYAIVAAVALLAATNLFSNRQGHTAGVNAQKVADQAVFSKYEKDIAEQKTVANAIYRASQDAVIKAQTELDTFKTQLENDRVKSKDEIELMRRQYATVGLRFTTTAKGAGCGSSSSVTNTTKSEAPGTQETVSVQLPETLTANLRQLAIDADELNSEYGICYKYINR